MSTQDKTKAVLQEALSELFRRQAEGSSTSQQTGSYLLAQDGQYLGSITENKYDQKSILNQYGPHGSQYSPTSIFNKYSNYASPYGQYSINNTYSTKPPQVFIKGKLSGYITKNKLLTKGIDPDLFIRLLKNNIKELLAGNLQEITPNSSTPTGKAYILAADGAYLGSLNPNEYDNNSIFSTYGPHGNEYSVTSIFSKYGAYGNEYSSLSPFNEFTTTPPRIMIGNRMIAWLSKNRFLTPRVDPDFIKEYAKKNAQ